MNVLLDAQTDQFIYLTGSGPDITVRRRVSAEIPTPIRIATPARAIAEFLQLIPAGDLDLQIQGQTLRVHGATFDTSFRVGNADDMLAPQADQLSLETKASLLGFASAVDQVRIAQSHDEHQPILNGIYLSIQPSSIVLAATDGHRAAETHTSATSEGGQVAVIVPVRALLELRSVLGSSDRTLSVGVSHGHNRIRFQAGADFLDSGLIEGTYPDYRKVLPTGPATAVVVDRLALTLALRACEVFARAGTNPVSLTATPGRIRLRGQSTELGENVSNLDAKVSGPEATVSLSGQYLLDGLVALTADTVSLEIRGQRTPVILSPRSRDKFWYAIAPRLALPK